jgi:hypothetical protein
MKMPKFILSIILIVLIPSISTAYNDIRTHKYITEVSIKEVPPAKSVFQNYLFYILGFKNDIRENINGKQIGERIKDGAYHEDLGYRGYNHFYNPLNSEGLDDWPWPLFRSYDGIQTRLNLCGSDYLLTGIPALKWAMGTGCRQCCTSSNKSEDDNCNDYSWQRARESYYQALTATSDRERNDQFSAFFEKLGRVVHLLQDMAVPAHVRNDMNGHTAMKDWQYIKTNDIKGIRAKFGNNYEN